MRKQLFLFCFSLSMIMVPGCFQLVQAHNLDSASINPLIRLAKTDLEEGRVEIALDSLESLNLIARQNTLPTQTHVEILSLLSNGYKLTNRIPELVEVLEEKIELHKEAEEDNQVLGTMVQLLSYLTFLESYDKMLPVAHETRRISISTKDTVRHLFSHLCLTSAFIPLGKLDSASHYSFKGIELSKEHKHALYEANFNLLLSRINTIQDKLTEAEGYLTEAIGFFEILQDSGRLFSPYNDLGLLYREQEKYLQAEEAFGKAIQIAIHIKRPDRQLIAYINLTKMYVENEDFEGAAPYLKRIDQLDEVLTTKEGKIEVGMIRAKIALDRGEYQRALLHIQTALQIAEEADQLTKFPDLLRIQTEIYTQQGDFEQALLSQQLLASYIDSLFSIEKNKTIEGLKAQYEAKEKEQLLLTQQNELAQYEFQWKVFLILAIILLLTGIGWIIIWRRNVDLQKKATASEQTILIEKNKSLVEINQFKSRFFTNISHELRTPISLILTPLSHLMDGFQQISKAEIYPILDIATRNSKKLIKLVEEILALSRLEEGKAKVGDEVLAIKRFCKQKLSMFHSWADQNRIDIRFESQLPEGLLIRTDPNKLDKILDNLISNALKYNEEGGRIGLTIRIQSQENPKDSSLLQMEVSDTGRGISAGDLPYIFDRFFQSSSKEAPLEGGSGIGLALAKELCQLMGGDLNVSSELGEGSIFSASIPVLVVPKEEAVLQTTESQLRAEVPILPIQEKAVHNKETSRILVVEDNTDVQWMLRELLSKEYSLLFAGDGMEALQILEKESETFHLIVSDIMMPRLNGYSLLNQLKSHPEWSEIPVIMLTARAGETDRLSALRMGVDDYMIKPFSKPELLARIQNLLNNYAKRKEATEQANNKLDIQFSGAQDVDLKWLEKLENAAKEGLEKGLSLNANFLANEMALGERQLRRRIKSLTGLNSKAYIQEVKLQKGRYLLENRAYQSLAEVAYASGFNTPYYFGQLFANRFGKNPSAYFK